MPRLDRLGHDEVSATVHHHLIFAFAYHGKYAQAEEAQSKLNFIVSDIADPRSKAYALATSIWLSNINNPYTSKAFEEIGRTAISAAANTDDAYIQYVVQYAIGWGEFHRGRVSQAQAAAQELMRVGRRLNDPRSLGFGMQLLGWIALTSDDYKAALGFAETGISAACTPFDLEASKEAHAVASVLLRLPEGYSDLCNFMEECKRTGWLYALVGADGVMGVALALRSEIGAAIRWMKASISKREQEMYGTAADWYRLFLCEIYLEVIAGKEKVPVGVLLRNASAIVSVMVCAGKAIPALVAHVRRNPHLDPNGHYIGRAEMIMGLLYKAKKKRALAVRHLTEAKRIVSQSDPTPMLAKIEAALAELV
jgi:hypothetical protein